LSFVRNLDIGLSFVREKIKIVFFV